MKKRYDSYKPSGIDWIGDIPTHWTLSKIKFIGEIRGRIGFRGYTTADLVSEGEGALTIGGKHISNNVIDLTDPEYISWDKYYESPEIMVSKGDIVIAQRGTLKRTAYISKNIGPATINPSLVLLTNIKINPKYLHSYLCSNATTEFIDYLNTATAVPMISQNQIENIRIIEPPLAEQEAIAAWLDEKCGEIDAAIAKVDREIELIDELKQSEISRVVTRGLNPDAPLRPSGIDWIGNIPLNWSSMKLKHTVKDIETDFMDGDWIESTDISTEGIRYLTSGNIGAGYYKEQGEGFISEETFAELNCIEVFPGDLLISRLNEPIARTCFIPDLGYRIVTCVDNVIYRPIGNLFDKRYIMYQLNCKPFWFNASQLSSGATMQRISRSKLGAIKVLVPPLLEQQAIADYLDKKCAEIDGLKAKLSKKRETLTELRQSIISEVVTGKRKVI